MNTMTLNWAPTSAPTASASDQGARFARARVLGRSQVNKAAPVRIQTISERLAGSLRQATDVVRESIRDLGEECASALIARITELLEPADWEEGDELLKVGSVRTLIRTLSALDCDLGSVAITRSGNLAVSWSDNGRNLRVECLPESLVSWALVRRDGDAIEATHKHGDTVANLRSACNS